MTHKSQVCAKTKRRGVSSPQMYSNGQQQQRHHQQQPRHQQQQVGRRNNEALLDFDYSDHNALNDSYRTSYTDSMGAADTRYTGAYTYNYSERGGTLSDSFRSEQTPYSHDATHTNSETYTTRPNTGTTRNNSNSGIYNRAYTNGGGTDDSSSHAIISSDNKVGRQGQYPYQIEFLVQNQGKQISSTKRIIHFRFGYADVSSMLKGKTGSDCRGEEHNIVVTWSITGGKKSIMMNNMEIHYVAGKRGATQARRADMLEAVWKLSDHVYELKCYAYKPAAGSPEKRNPRWKQYSLVIDGTSYFDLPQIFDLGLKGLTTVISAPPSLIHSNIDPSSMSGLNSSMRSYQSNHSSESKDSIQARIFEQRRLLDARKNSLSAEMRKARSSPARKAHTVSANTHDTGVHSSGLESGVYSAAPSELDEVKNRMQAPPPQTSASSASTMLNQLAEFNRFSNNAISQRQFLHQRQIQSQHNSNSEQRPCQRDQLVRLPPPPTRPATNEEAIRNSLGEYDRACNRKSVAVPPDMMGAVCNRMSTLDLSLRSDAQSVDTTRDDSTYVSAASFVPQKLTLTKPSAPATTTNLPQGVPPPQGVNKWGYY